MLFLRERVVSVLGLIAKLFLFTQSSTLFDNHQISFFDLHYCFFPEKKVFVFKEGKVQSGGIELEILENERADRKSIIVKSTLFICAN